MNGWIKIHRTMLEWEHFNEPSVVTVFLALLLNADRDGKTDISLRGLTSATGLTTNTVRCALAKLVDSGEITREFTKGQNTTTSIANWSKYQVYQKSTHQDKEGISKNDTPHCQKLIHPVSKIDTPTHTYIDKNNKKDNKNTTTTTCACARERLVAELLTDGRIELAMMQHHITVEEYRLMVNEILADWQFRDLPDADYNLNHFSSVMRYKVASKKNRSNGNNQQTGDIRHQLVQDAIKAMAALEAESRHPADLPF